MTSLLSLTSRRLLQEVWSFVRTVWFPLLQKARVSLVVSGHSHVYQRGQSRGVHVAIIGGSGGDLDYVKAWHWGINTPPSPLTTTTTSSDINFHNRSFILIIVWICSTTFVLSILQHFFLIPHFSPNSSISILSLTVPEWLGDIYAVTKTSFHYALLQKKDDRLQFSAHEIEGELIDRILIDPVDTLP